VAAVHALWIRLPILVQAVVAGLAVATAGTVPWAAPLPSCRVRPERPDRVPPVAHLDEGSPTIRAQGASTSRKSRLGMGTRSAAGTRCDHA